MNQLDHHYSVSLINPSTCLVTQVTATKKKDASPIVRFHHRDYPVRVWVHIMSVSPPVQLPVKPRHRLASVIQTCPGQAISINFWFCPLLPSSFRLFISRCLLVFLSLSSMGIITKEQWLAMKQEKSLVSQVQSNSVWTPGPGLLSREKELSQWSLPTCHRRQLKVGFPLGHQLSRVKKKTTTPAAETQTN